MVKSSILCYFSGTLSTSCSFFILCSARVAPLLGRRGSNPQRSYYTARLVVKDNIYFCSSIHIYLFYIFFSPYYECWGVSWVLGRGSWVVGVVRCFVISDFRCPSAGPTPQCTLCKTHSRPRKIRGPYDHARAITS